MKPQLPLLVLLVSSSATLAQTHGHGGYYSSHTSGHYGYADSYSAQTAAAEAQAARQRAAEQRAAQERAAAQQRAAEQRAAREQAAAERAAAQRAAQQRATEQRAATARAAQERAAQRAEESRQAMMNSLEEIARRANANFTPATVPAQNPGGYDCIAYQGGGMNCYRQTDMNAPSSYAGQQVIRVPETYSGSISGGGYNNPAMENVRNTGPTPSGQWNVTGVAQTLTNSSGQTSAHQNVLHLQPAAGTETYGRTDIRAHGDNSTAPGTASSGCLIVPRDVRQTLAGMVQQGGQVRIEVRR